jgi:flagellar hook protein FlgE
MVRRPQFTFGPGAGQVATLAQLQSAIGAISGVTATVNTANGNISLTSNNSLILNSNPPALLAEFGINKTAAYPSNDTVIANDTSTFTAESIDGGSITAYDSLGNPVNVQFRWAQTSSGSWQLFYQSNSNATGTQAAWQNVGTVFNFNSTGQLTPAPTSVTLQNLTINGDNLGNVQLNFGGGGLTQYANASGTAQLSQLQQNGFAAGQLQSDAVDGQNRIT